MKPTIYSDKDIKAMDKISRLNFINSIPGFKSANLIATASKDGKYNLAIFSSVIHLGSNPALLGFILRPTTVKRHTWENIQAHGLYTINHVHESIIAQAHQTSAKYPDEVSEFEETGLHPEPWADHPVPFVRESRIRIGMAFEEVYDIRVNGTKLVVGRILEIRIPDDIMLEDGSLDLVKAGTATISGLNRYHGTRFAGQFEYARP